MKRYLNYRTVLLGLYERLIPYSLKVDDEGLKIIISQELKKLPEAFKEELKQRIEW